MTALLCLVHVVHLWTLTIKHSEITALCFGCVADCQSKACCLYIMHAGKRACHMMSRELCFYLLALSHLCTSLQITTVQRIICCLFLNLFSSWLRDWHHALTPSRMLGYRNTHRPVLPLWHWIRVSWSFMGGWLEPVLVWSLGIFKCGSG